jgi:predicted O-methyltransferase YrrM
MRNRVMRSGRTEDNSPSAIRRQLRLVRRRLDIALCGRRVRRFPADETVAGIVDFAMRERAIAVQQVPSEIVEFAILAAERKARTTLEIGTSRGGSLFILCRLAAPDGTIISVDMPGAGYGEAYTPAHARLFQLFPSKGQSLSLVKADSHHPGTRRRVEDLLNGKQVELLFIDGDHSYEGVKKDFEMYSPLVADGGMIAFHDIAVHTKFANCEVDRFWNEVKQNYRHREIIDDTKQGWAGIGILWKDPQ